MFDKQTAEFLGTMGQNTPPLSREEMQYWIGKPKELQRFLAGLKLPTNGKKPEFKIWKEIEIGVDPRDGDGLTVAIEKDKMLVSSWAKDMLTVKDERNKPRFVFFPKLVRIPLIKVSVEELGLTAEWNRYEDICKKAWDLGLGLCPDEVGPQLRLQYPEQPLGEWLIIAMKAILGSGGNLDVFRVVRSDDGRWLSGDSGRPGYRFARGRLFVFVPREFLESLES